MWEVETKITITSAEGDYWGEEQTAATLKVNVNHMGEDDQGEYLPDDEVTHDKVYEAVAEWQQMTGIQEDENTIIEWHYEPEKAKRI